MDRNHELIPLIRDEQERAIRAAHLVAVAQCARRCCATEGRLARLTRVFRSTPTGC
jgi:hypothetical protein